MPIPVGPSTPTLTPITSSDGSLRATYDPSTASVLLRLNATASSDPGHAVVTKNYFTFVGRDPNPLPDPGVRGMDGVAAPAGVVAGIDHEAPLGTPVTYRASWLATDESGDLTFSAAITLTLPAHRTRLWIKSLSTPALSVCLSAENLTQRKFSIPTSVSGVLGARAPFVSQGVRGLGVAGLSVHCQSDDEVDRFLALVQTPGPYLLQWPWLVGASRAQRPDAYVYFGDVSESQPTPDVFRSFSMDVTEVEKPPTPNWLVTLPGRSYNDIVTKYPTYSVLPNVPYVDLA